MQVLERIRQLLRDPTYRTRLAFFGLLGIVVILLAIVIKDPFWSSVFSEFAVVFSAVALIEFLWDFLGGDPMEHRIQDVQGEVVHTRDYITSSLSNTVDSLDDELTSLKHSMNLLADLIDGNIGIERIWKDRRAWQRDSTHGLETWQTWVCQASEVDIMTNTLWNNWMHQEGFRKELFANIDAGASVRILLYDPESDILKQRAKDERDVALPIGDTIHYEMQQEIGSTLRWLAEHWVNFKESAKGNLELRLTHQSIQYVQLIRADDRMLVAIYLSGKSGGPSPTMQLRGPETAYFKKYADQFDTMWGRGRPVDDAEFEKMLDKYGGIQPPPPEN